MGAKPTKFHQLYKKIIRRQKQSRKGPSSTEFDISDDDRFPLLSSNHPLVLEMELTTNFEHKKNEANLNEIRQMKQELAVRIHQIHIILDEIEIQHNRELDECADQKLNEKMNASPVVGDPLLEESRLRNAFLMEKLRTCHEQLSQTEDPFPTPRQKEGKDKNTFIRQLLVKTARRQFKKSRLNDAVDTFYQLIVATNGRLCSDEAWLLFDICSQKVAGTYEFYHRIGELVRQLDPGTSKYIVNELWSSIVEDLRSECSDLYDVVMSVCVEIAEPLEEACVAEKLKHLCCLRVCSLWLQLTPLEHEEFDDIKDLFYDSLNKDVEAFANLASFDKNNTRAGSVFHAVIEDLYTNYPVVAKTRKMQNIASKILRRKVDAIPYMLKDR